MRDLSRSTEIVGVKTNLEINFLWRASQLPPMRIEKSSLVWTCQRARDPFMCTSASGASGFKDSQERYFHAFSRLSFDSNLIIDDKCVRLCELHVLNKWDESSMQGKKANEKSKTNRWIRCSTRDRRRDKDFADWDCLTAVVQTNNDESTKLKIEWNL